MRPLMRFWFRLDSPRMVATTFVLFLLAYFFLNSPAVPFSLPAFQMQNGGLEILNVQPFYTAETAYRQISLYTPEAIRIYHQILAFDLLVLIPLYVLFLSSALRHAGTRVLGRRIPRLVDLLPAVPLVAGGLNIVEDALLFVLLRSYPLRLEGLANVAGMITASKTLLLTLSFLSVLVLYALIAWSRATYRLGLRQCHV